MTNPKFFTICIILSLISCVMVAQENITVESTADTTVEKYDKMLKYFVLDKTEVKQLFKTDLFQLALKRLNISYERKISKKLSVEFEGLEAIYSNPYAQSTFGYSSPGTTIFYLNFNTDLKFYHNIDRRIRKGKNTNGFSANYFLMGLSAHLTFFSDDDYRINNDGTLQSKNWTGEFDPDNTPMSNYYFIDGKHEPRESIYYLKCGYGIQRRIGNIGYFALNTKIGFGTNKSTTKSFIMPEVGIKAGFAIQSFRRRK